MEKLFAWLEVEPSGRELWKFFAKVIFGLWCFAVIIEAGFNILGVNPPADQRFDYLIKEHPVLIMSLLPLFAAIEEFIFRLPLILFIWKNAQPKTMLMIMIFLSVIFGLGHGGWVGVPIQGVMGFIFCLVFLKCGGMQKKYMKAFFSSTGVHFAYNFIVIGTGIIF